LVFKASRGIEDVYELTKIRKDGSRFPAVVSVTALRNGQGGIIGYLLIGTDNTARQRIEEERKAALRELNDLKAAIDAHAIIAITNARGRITYVNDKFCAISQFSRGELLGRDHRIINSGFHSKEFIRGLWTAISAGNVWKGDIKNRAKDGTFYWMDTTIVPCLDADGKPVHYTAIRADITERKRFEHALQQTNMELEHARLMAEQANRAKSEFLSGMSHELRTPLNGIIGFTEFLIDEKPGPLRPKQKEYLGDVLNSGRHLLQLINDVLDLAKVEAGKMELHLETFPVRKAVEEVTAVIQGIASKKQISITIEVGPDLDAVTLDQQKFKQILYNLLSNAVKFSDDRGRISIRASRLDPQQLQVEVRDSGIGIKAEDIHRLFSEFEQLDSGPARRFEGTGLGLALTKKIVEFQNGRIRVESQPGLGSAFTVLLPLILGDKGSA
jgi:PAS domain S-box-containing protein